MPTDNRIPPLNEVTAPNVSTRHAAYYLGRRPGTLRNWSTEQVSAPLRPRRINGRLAWPVTEIRALVGVA